MIRVIIHGVCGRMGRTIVELVKKGDTDISIVAGIDKNAEKSEKDFEFPLFSRLVKCNVAADVVIDFSTKTAVPSLIEDCIQKKIALVLCTTGLDDDMVAKVNEASKSIAILRSANMSLGINMMAKLIRVAAKTMYDADFDVEIMEKHHRMKLDAPSGTAMTLADEVNESLGGDMEYIFDRSHDLKQRERNEIGIVAIRGGSIVGEHEIIFAGEDEILSIKHEAASRDIFAKGALVAAKFLYDKTTGLYSMNDVL